jgi:glycosyltransferase involved in cell wall biosynthesis
MIEASAAGLPVVSTSTDGGREIVVDGETGILVPVRDADALADGVVKMLNDPALARRMGERGRQHVARRFDNQMTTDRWVGMWRAVAAGKAPCDPLR